MVYPLASMFAGQDAAGIGWPTAGFVESGAMAHSAPLRQSRRSCSNSGSNYIFIARKVYNLNADDFIKDHLDARGRHVAHAVLAVVATA
jgi:hypothetical protein